LLPVQVCFGIHKGTLGVVSEIERKVFKIKFKSKFVVLQSFKHTSKRAARPHLNQQTFQKPKMTVSNFIV
jgi:hypothetical protein